MAPAGKFSRAPSPYPGLLFHALRLAQLVSSTIVLSFLAFFVHYLIADHYYIPWTFVVLLAVASFTDASVVVTSFFYHFRALQPRLSSLINGGLTLLWVVGFVMITWNLSGTLSNACTVANWDHETGVMVCRIYKAIETFTIVGMVTTAASLALDLYLIRQTRARGIYNPMDEPAARLAGGHKAPLFPHQHTRTASDVDAFAARDLASEEPSLEFPEYSHEAKRPYKAQRAMSAERWGYRHPEEQTSYEGAAARMLDRQFADHD